MEVWMIVSASPHTLSPFTPIQGQHHTMSHIPTITMSHIPTITMSHIPTITMSHIPTIKMSHIPTITIFPYYYNCHVQYSWFWKKIGLYKSYKLILLHVRINCILKKQRCLCNSKIKFQIPPLAGKNRIELFS